jgi:hypothetical protein
MELVIGRWWGVFPAVLLVALTSCVDTSGRPSSAATPVTIHLSLDKTTGPAGKPIKGEAVLTNTTSEAITVKQCAIDGWLEVGLSSNQIQFAPAMSEVGCRPTVRLVPGVNRFLITVSTDYQACLAGGQSGTISNPACAPSGGQPSLPEGRYSTKVVTFGLPASTQMPRPIKVTLTAPR